ncbi:MAG: UbiA family prenyltransferase [Phycisphaerales bacterium]|nr:UbiA family prenyltransferase [Phycisphaerales bacterium]MCB9837569.1 UbiA family prenyltransferase [Phycisphaera sp.]
MRGLIQRVAPVLQLTRVTGAFSAVANVWFVIVWTRAFEQEPGTTQIDERSIWFLLAGGAVAALGLYAFGAALNDILDAKRDRTLRPNRPLAAERISEEIAMSVVIGTLVCAILGALVLGAEAVTLTAVAAIGITIYNVAGKFVPAIGLPVLALVYAGHMLAPNHRLVFTLPVWLVMTHAMVVGGLAHTMEHRVPRLSSRAVLFAIAGWAACSAVLLAHGTAQSHGAGIWPSWVPWQAVLWIGTTAIVFSLVCYRRVRRLGFNERSGEKVRRYGTLWPAVYACAWLVGAGKLTSAWPLIALLVMGVLGMTILREAYAMVEDPIEFRR